MRRNAGRAIHRLAVAASGVFPAAFAGLAGSAAEGMRERHRNHGLKEKES